MESKSLAIRQEDTLETVGKSDWDLIMDQARVLHASGFLPREVNTPEKAVAIIVTGRELGIPTMAALRGIDIIQGTPAVSPALMLGLAFRSKSLEEFAVLESTEQICRVRVKRRGFPAREEAFSMEDARRIKTTEGSGADRKTISLSEKYNWRQMPKVMLRWRAISAALRIDFSDIFFGLYTPDELGAPMTVEDEPLAASAHPEPSLGPSPLKAAIPEIVADAAARQGAPRGDRGGDWQRPAAVARDAQPARPAPAQDAGAASPRASAASPAQPPEDARAGDPSPVQEEGSPGPLWARPIKEAEAFLDDAQRAAEGVGDDDGAAEDAPLDDPQRVVMLRAEILVLCEKMGIADPPSSLGRWIKKNYKDGQDRPVEGGLDGLMTLYATAGEFAAELERIRDQFQKEYEVRVQGQIEGSVQK